MIRTPESLTVLYVLALALLASTPLFVPEVQFRVIHDPIFRVSAILNFILMSCGFLLVQKLMTQRARIPQPPAPGGVAHHPVIARPTLRSKFVHEPEMADVLEQYVAGLPQQVEQLHQFLSNHQNADLRRLTHQIKGSGGGYGFMAITDAAAELENLLDAGARRDIIVAHVHQLIEIIRSVEGFDAKKLEREAA